MWSWARRSWGVCGRVARRVRQVSTVAIQRARSAVVRIGSVILSRPGKVWKACLRLLRQMRQALSAAIQWARAFILDLWNLLSSVAQAVDWLDLVLVLVQFINVLMMVMSMGRSPAVSCFLILIIMSIYALFRLWKFLRTQHERCGPGGKCKCDPHRD